MHERRTHTHMFGWVWGRFIAVYRSGRNVGRIREGAHGEVDGGATGGMEMKRERGRGDRVKANEGWRGRDGRKLDRGAR